MPALLQQARSSGHVRIIVTLRLAGAAGGASQAIVQARSRLLERLPSAHVSVLGGRTWSFPSVVLEADATGLNLLARSPFVAGIEPDSLLRPADAGSDTDVGAPQAWNLGYSGSGEAIAILDTGVQDSHPFLGGRVIAEACFSGGGQAGSSLCPNGQASQVGVGAAAPCTSSEDCSHGTAMAGIAAGDGTYSGGPGFSGVAPQAKIVAVQVYSTAGPSAIAAYESDVINGLNWVYQESAAIPIAAVNLSFAAPDTDYSTPCDALNPAIVAAIAALRAAGIATVVATGNDGLTDGIEYPSCVSNAISTGAVDDDDSVPSFGDRGSNLMFWAPGVAVASADATSGFMAYTGTSDSAAVLSGAFAVIRSAAPHVTLDQILSALKATGRQINDPVSGVTAPRIQIDAAIASLLNLAPTATPTPSAIVTPTGTASATVSPSIPVTATATMIVAPTTTETPTATLTTTPSATATPSRTATRTATPNRSATASHTATATATRAPRASLPATPALLSSHVARAITTVLGLQISGLATLIHASSLTTFTLQTAPGAKITVTLQIVQQQSLSGPHGRTLQPTRLVVLYQTTFSGVADKLGCYHGHLHMAFRPAKTMNGTLVVAARSGHRVVSKSIRVRVCR